MGVDYDDVTETLELEGVQKFADSFEELLDGVRSKRGQLAAASTVNRAELIDRIWERDPTVWTGADEAKWLGWLDEPASGCASASPSSSQFADEVADDGLDAIVLLGMGGSSLAPEVLRRTFRSEAFHVLDTTHPQRDPRARGDDRPRAHALHLGVEVGLDARDALAHRLLLGAHRQARRVLRRDHRSRLRARADGRRARLSPRLRGRADDRRPLLGALALRHRPRRADGHRRRPPARERRADDGALPAGQRQPGLRARPRARRRLAGGARQGLHRRDRRRLRPLGRAADRGVDRQAGQGARARAGRVAGRPRPPGRERRRSPTRTRSAASSSAGSSPSRSQARTSRSTRSTSRTCRRRRTRRTRCSPPAASPRSSSRARSTSCSRRRRERDYVCVQAFIEPSEENDRRIADLVQKLRRLSGLVVTHGYGPRYLHSTGQLHKGGPNTGLFLQVVDDPARSSRSPASRSASGA